MTLALACVGLYAFSATVVLSLLRASGRSEERLEIMFADGPRPGRRDADQELAA